MARRPSRPRSTAAASMLLLVLSLSGSSEAQAPAPDPSTAAADLLSPSEELASLDKQEFDLGRALESARLDLLSGERRFAAAQERLDDDPEPSEALREEVAARRLQLSAVQRGVALLEEAIERVADTKEAVRRLRALGSQQVPPEELAVWLAEAEARLEQWERELSLKHTRAEELSQELAFVRERREQLPARSDSERWMRSQAQALEELVERYETDVRGLESAVQIERRLAVALRQQTEQLPLSARLRALLHRVTDVWNYPLSGGDVEPITPGKIVGAIAIFLIGYFVARSVSRALGSRIFPRMRLEAGASQAFQSLSFYLLLLIAFLTALRMVQIPLTAFAVLGGALAIGVGFGSQNVVNNFISGLILLAERPIKIGDLIEVESVYGTVERIGLRSTRVRTGDNIHIIVPNAAFLESKVINWTHTDARVRITIKVGIVYGSPTREAERLIRKALAEHPKVLTHPDPVVLFRDFGDDSLVFEVRFWIEMRTMLERLQIESQLRFAIDDLFREAGIVIAFPQRDVHLDAAAPIEVRVVDRGGSGAGET